MFRCKVCGDSFQHMNVTMICISCQEKYPEKPLPAPLAELGIVGACPTCGAPVYGSPIIKANEEPIVRFSCCCQTMKAIGKVRTT